jgi:hypothetical protein
MQFVQILTSKSAHAEGEMLPDAGRAGLNLYQINSQLVGGNYTGPLLLGISKRALVEGRHSSPAFVAFSGWDADTSFALVPSTTQARAAGH